MKMKKYGLIIILSMIIVFACSIVIVAWNMEIQFQSVSAFEEITRPEGEVTQTPAYEETKSEVEPETKPEEDDFIVCLDPGHGGQDVGTSSNGVYEKDQALELALMVKDYLESRNIKVIMTRTKDCTVGLDERVEFANENGADVIVAVHRNFYEGWSTINGIESWIRSDRPQEGVDLASFIMDRLAAAGGMDIRGIRSGCSDNPEEDYRINRNCTMPSMILEMGYMSDKSDNAAFVKNKEKYAEAIALGIIDFMEKYSEENLDG